MIKSNQIFMPRTSYLISCIIACTSIQLHFEHQKMQGSLYQRSHKALDSSTSQTGKLGFQEKQTILWRSDELGPSISWLCAGPHKVTPSSLTEHVTQLIGSLIIPSRLHLDLDTICCQCVSFCILLHSDYTKMCSEIPSISGAKDALW